MTVYVDDMRAPFGNMLMCHMVADCDDELHAMAARVGVARRWWQSPLATSGSHYDIAMSKRALAVANGAVEITMRQCAAMNARRRLTGELGSPHDAIDWLKQFRALMKAARGPAPVAAKGSQHDEAPVRGCRHIYPPAGQAGEYLPPGDANPLRVPQHHAAAEGTGAHG